MSHVASYRRSASSGACSNEVNVARLQRRANGWRCELTMYKHYLLALDSMQVFMHSLILYKCATHIILLNKSYYVNQDYRCDKLPK